MSHQSFRHDKEELKELLHNYDNLKSGRSFTYIEEDGFERIIEYFNEKEKFTQALEAVNFSIEQFPYSTSLLVKKADILISLRCFDDALKILELASNFGVEDSAFFIIKIDALLALELNTEADEVFCQAIESCEQDEKVNLLFELTEVYDDYEYFDKVFDCLRMILELDSSNEEALYKICFWTDFTGRNEEGIKLYQTIINQSPFNELAWFNLGAAYQGIKLYEKSIDAYQYAIAIEDKFDYAYRNMADAFIKLKKFNEAIEALEKVINLSRPESVIYEAIGHCHDKLSNFTQARSNYKKAVHLNPEDTQLHYKIGCTYMQENSWNNAIKSLQTALKIFVMQPEYNLAIGRCYLELHNYEDAITYLGNVVRVRPKNINGWIELLNCFHQAELYDDGFEYAAIAFEQTGSKIIFVYYQSAFLFASGQSKQALIYLENALHVNPKLVKHFIELNPSILQNQLVVDLLAKYKKTKK
jgi:tetratricopeptide (TPR) repeat protein